MNISTITPTTVQYLVQQDHVGSVSIRVLCTVQLRDPGHVVVLVLMIGHDNRVFSTSTKEVSKSTPTTREVISHDRDQKCEDRVVQQPWIAKKRES